METFTNPLLWIAVLVAVGVIYSIYKRDKIKGNTSDPAKNITAASDDAPAVPYKEESGSIPVFMPDNLTARYYETSISERTAIDIIKEYGTLGRQWDRSGKKLYAINRFKNDAGVISLRPCAVGTKIIYPSSVFFNDLTQTEVPLAFQHIMKDDQNKSLGEQIMKYLPWLLAFGFLAWLWAFS